MNNNKTVAWICNIGPILTKTKEEELEWKKRMITAGIPGISFPDDWDDLPYEEKSKRIEGVIEKLAT